MTDTRNNDGPAVGAWQPIETAPKDGTAILTVIQGFRPAVTQWVEFEGEAKFSHDPETFAEEDHFHEYFFGGEYEPTHWMPLPEGPEMALTARYPSSKEA